MKKILLLLSLILVNAQVIAGIPLSTNFTVNTALPIEDRMSVADLTARDAIPALRRWEGMIVYVVSEGSHFTLAGGITNGDWGEVAGGGGISDWLTATDYIVGSVVIDSDKIYQSLSIHTSGVFATDLANGEWKEISASEKGISNWITATGYTIGNVVIESNKIYQALTAHTSGVFLVDLANGEWVELSTADFQKIYNSSVSPQITTDATLGAVDIQRGSASDTDNVLRVKNGAGDTTAKITGEGRFNSTFLNSDNMAKNGDIELTDVSMFTCGASNTCARTTASGEYSKGLAALKVSTTASALNVSQTVTTPSGIQKQGYVRLLYKIPATITDAQICSLVDAAEQNCVPSSKLIANGLFNQIEIPLIFGTTSAGFKIKTTATYTQDVFIDNVILAQGLGTQNYVTGVEGTTIQKFTSGSGTYTPTAGTLKIKVRMVGGGGGGSGSGTGGFGGGSTGGQTLFGTSLLVSNGGTGAGAPIGNGGGGGSASLGTGPIGTTTIGGAGGSGSYGSSNGYASSGTGGNSSFGGGGFNGTTGSNGGPGSANTGGGGGGAGTNGTVNAYSGNGGGAGGSISAIIIPTSGQTFSYTVGAGGAGGTAGTGGFAGGAGGSGYIEVTEYQAPSSANVYSQASADYSRRAYTPTFTGFGTTSSVDCYESREGEFLNIDCRFTSGTSTSVEARVSLPTGLTSSANMQTLSVRGVYQRSISNAETILVTAEPSVSYVTFSRQDAAEAGLARDLGTAVSASGQSISFTARIPISGWSNANSIIGSFAGYNSTPGIVNPKVFSGVIAGATSSTRCTGTCTVYNAKGSVIGVATRSTAGEYSLAVSGLSGVPNCAVSSNQDWTVFTSQPQYRYDLSSSTALIFNNSNTSTGARTDGYFTFSCHGE